MLDSDFAIENHGSIMLLRPITAIAEEWIEEHVGNDETLTWGDATVVEPRYIGPIIEAMLSEGFVLQA